MLGTRNHPSLIPNLPQGRSGASGLSSALLRFGGGCRSPLLSRALVWDGFSASVGRGVPLGCHPTGFGSVDGLTGERGSSGSPSGAPGGRACKVGAGPAHAAPNSKAGVGFLEGFAFCWSGLTLRRRQPVRPSLEFWLRWWVPSPSSPTPPSDTCHKRLSCLFRGVVRGGRSLRVGGGDGSRSPPSW